MIYRIKLTTVIVLLSIFFNNNSYSQKIEFREALDKFFISQLDTFNLVAINSAIVKDDKMIWSSAAGYKNREKKEAVSLNTLFHQGSISKTITLAAFLHLCEKKEIDLHEEINTFLPFEVINPYNKETPITLYMLITHTSSFNDVNIPEKNNKLRELYENKDSNEKLGSTLKNILTKNGTLYTDDLFVKDKPGNTYNYSNIAYSLLAYIIEEESGIPFTSYCRKYIFDPLDMKQSTFLLSETDTTNFAFQYSKDKENSSLYKKVQPFTWPGYPDGSLRTNILEYSNFLIMVINKGKFKSKHILSEKSINLMLKEQDLPGKQNARLFQPAGRTLLWNKIKVPVGKDVYEIYHFNGFGTGFFTEVFFSTDAKIAGMFFTTGQFTSFPMMGRAIKENLIKLIEASSKI